MTNHTVTFAAGSRAACVKGTTWLFVDAPLTHPMVLEAWGVIDNAGTADEVAGVILSHGMTQAPDFLLASSNDDGGVRFIVRGPVRASGVAGGEVLDVRARGILTDATVPDVERFIVSVGEGAVARPTMPVIAGILPVDVLSVELVVESGLSRGTASPSVTATDDNATVPPPAATQGPTHEPQPSSGALALERDAEPRLDRDAEPRPEPVSSSSTREDERLFGAPGTPPTNDPPRTQPGTSASKPFLPDGVSIAEAGPPTPVAPGQAGVSTEATVAPAPGTIVPVSSAPTSGGIIESLPDFFGPLSTPSAAATAGAEISSAQPAVTAAQPTLEQPNTPASSAAPPPPAQGRTVNRAHLPAASPAGPTVWAAFCPVGHPSQAFAAHCRVCGQSIPAQDPQEIPRPVLGRLLVPGSPEITLDGDLVMGRDPHVPPGSAPPAPRLIVLNDPRMEVSSMHAAVTLNFWDVCLTDLGSTNGTEIVTAEGRRQRLAQQTPITIAPGTRIVLAEVLELVFEATG